MLDPQGVLGSASGINVHKSYKLIQYLTMDIHIRPKNVFSGTIIVTLSPSIKKFLFHFQYLH